MNKAVKIAVIVILAAALVCAAVYLLWPKDAADDAPILTGLQVIDGDIFYFDADGQHIYGWQTVDGKLYYFNPADGRAMHGWFTDIDGSMYYFDVNGAAVTGEQTIDDKSYLFDENGKLQEPEETADYEWRVLDGIYYCFGPNGEPLVDLQEIAGSLYYFNDEGARQTGWQDLEGRRYYFEPQTGRAAKGWMTIDNATYYFGTDGYALTGDQTIGGEAYQFNTDGKLVVKASGGNGGKNTQGSSSSSSDMTPVSNPEANVPAATYTLVKNADGTQSWVKPDGTVLKGFGPVAGGYGMGDATTGQMLTGRQTDGTSWYYLDEVTGLAKTGWIADAKNPDTVYYYGAQGPAYTNLQTVGTELYYFDTQTGARQTGLWMLDGRLYYFAGEDDRALVGWQTIAEAPKTTQAQPLARVASVAEKRYYFGGEKFALTGLQEIPDGNGTVGVYAFDSAGVQLAGWQTLDGKMYWFNGTNHRAITGQWAAHEKGTVYLGEKGTHHSGYLELNDEKYYLGSDGFLVYGWVNVDGKYYCFEGTNGAALKNAWCERDGGYGYLGADGVAYTGLRTAPDENGTEALYAFTESGLRVAGWHWDGDALYYFGTDGKAVQGWANDGSKTYYLGADYHALKGVHEVDSATYYFNEATAVREGSTTVKTVNGAVYLFNGDDYRAHVGPYSDGVNVYHFGSNGAALTGVQKLEDGAYYYFDNDGVRRTGWRTHNNAKYYFDEGTAKAHIGWFTDIEQKTVFYFDEEGKAVAGARTIDEVAYKFGNDGRLSPETPHGESNWVRDGEKVYFVGQDGNYVTGLLYIDGALYSFNENGLMETGWKTAEGKRYYFDAADEGRAVSGWFTDADKKNYYFGADGSAYAGVKKIEDNWYYFDVDKWHQRTGAANVEGARYYFDPENSGKAHHGWYPQKSVQDTTIEVRYYDLTTAQALTGKQKINDALYLFNDKGVRQAGWYEDTDGTRYLFAGADNSAWIGHYANSDGTEVYYFGTDGGAYTGIRRLPEDGKLYCFSSAGLRQYGWQRDGSGNKYYFGDDGAAKAGLFTDQETQDTYYFDEENGYALVGTHEMADGRTYVFDKDGRLLSREATTGYEWKESDGKRYYANSAGEHFTGLTWLDADGQLYFFEEDGAARSGWVTIGEGSEAKKYYFDLTSYVAKLGWYIDANGDRYYFDSAERFALTGMQTIGVLSYDFGDDGVLKPEYNLPVYDEWVEQGDGIVYFDSTGQKAVGLKQIGTDLYYFSMDGLRQSGWHVVEGNRYYFGMTDGKAHRGWQQLEDGWYLFDDASGKQQTGWQERTAGAEKYTYYYVPASGKAAKGFTNVNGVWCYFFEDGHMALGWQKIGEDSYYFHSPSGERASGVVTIDGVRYSFTEEGKLSDGWNSDGEKNRYYFVEGKALTGWNQLSDGRWYVFHDTDGYQLTGWQNRLLEDNSQLRYYYDANGNLPAAGWSTVNGLERYFFTEGHMATGWQLLDGWLYYFTNQGEKMTGNSPVRDITYPFDTDGRLQPGWGGEVQTGRRYYTLDGAALGWKEIDDVWYVFDAKTGIQKTGWQTRYDGEIVVSLHYFNPATGTALAGDWATVDGMRCYFYADGVAARGWTELGEDGVTYYFDNTGAMATGVVTIEGVTYSFGSDGKLLQGWNTDAQGNRYYFTADGALKGWQKIKETTYRFDDTTGIQLLGWQTRAVDGDTLYYYYDEAGNVAEPGWNDKIDDDVRYVLADGQMADGWQKLDEGRYYFRDYGVVMTGWQQVEGRWYIFDEDGKQLTGWQTRTVTGGYEGSYYYHADGSLPQTGWNDDLDGERRYVLADGTLAKGWETIESYDYYFVANGIPHIGEQEIDGQSYIFDSQGRYVTPPVISAVNYSSGSGTNKKISITATTSALLNGQAVQYSFDSGKTWQDASAKEFAGGVTIAAGTLQVKDAVGNVTTYDESFTVPATFTTKNGIDVSKYQGSINWASVKASGIEFAIIRSLCWDSDKNYYAIDPYFDYNVRQAKANGIKVGTYLYSYATSHERAVEEVMFFMNSSEVKNLMRDGVYFDLPVYIDYEDPYITNKTPNLTKDARADIVRTAMVVIDQQSRKMYGKLMTAGFYTYYYFANSAVNARTLESEGYEFWIANYTGKHGWHQTPPIWQYSSSGSVSGIGGRVDMNYMYKDYFTGSGTVTPPDTGNTTQMHNLTVKDINTGKEVTAPANEILARIVANEVRGFNNAEVYKAQAVAAQSWIKYQNATGVVAPQVGLGTPTTAIQAAADEVAKNVLTYNGTYALTPYFAYSNGYTNDARYWNASNNFPYLTTVEIPYDAQVKGSYTNYISQEKLRERLIAIYGSDITSGYAPQDWIKITGRNSGGYVTSIEVCGRKPGVEYFYLNILPYTGASGSKVYPVGSPSFDVSYDGKNFNFTTTGYGHCIGMSQTGAYGLALQGYNFQQILAYFYKGTILTTI